MKLMRILTVVTLCGIYVLFASMGALTLSLLPVEADGKGVSPSQYSSIFGAGSLSTMLITPLYARFGSKIGLKWMCVAGTAAQGICSILFGLMTFINDISYFIGLSYVINFILGLGAAALESASFAFLMNLFISRAYIVPVFGGVSLGIGFMIGPQIGTLLFSFSGFGLPFYANGAAVLIFSLILILLMPNTLNESIGNERDKNSETQELLPKPHKGDQTLTYVKVFKNVHFIAIICISFVGAFGNKVIDSMLQDHMMNSEANATQPQAATAISLKGMGSLVSLVAVICIFSKVKNFLVMSLIGSIVLTIAYSFIGPVPYLPLLPSVFLIDGSVALFTLGFVFSMNACYNRLVKNTEDLGFVRVDGTNIMIAGIYQECLMVGGFLGSTLSGLLVDTLGFQYVCLLLQILQVGCISVDIILYFNKKRKCAEHFKECDDGTGLEIRQNSTQ